MLTNRVPILAASPFVWTELVSASMCICRPTSGTALGQNRGEVRRIARRLIPTRTFLTAFSQ